MKSNRSNLFSTKRRLKTFIFSALIKRNILLLSERRKYLTIHLTIVTVVAISRISPNRSKR